MAYDFYITQEERHYLRELAKKQLEYSKLPVMEERKQLWYEHNSLKAKRPVVVMEMITFEDEMLPVSKCESPAAKRIETEINKFIINHEMIDDDKVVPPYYTINWDIKNRQFDREFHMNHVKDSNGKEVGSSWEHAIEDLKDDFPKLKQSVFSIDREYTMAWKEFVEENIGDILPVKIKNNTLEWFVAPSIKVVHLMGLENMMYSMLDYPDEMHMLYKFLVDDIMRFVKWQEKENLLVLNNENDYAGAGSYGFTDELPKPGGLVNGKVSPKDIWVNMNSQETVGISPEMYEEFIFPYYRELAEKFGLVYYGCCEPVHEIWDSCISKLPNLRKVSVSPWCDEAFMGEALKNGKVIYSRKPSPNFIGVGTELDEDAFKKHIAKTLYAAKDCGLEFIFRDIYTLSGNKAKPGRGVQIVRELTNSMW